MAPSSRLLLVPVLSACFVGSARADDLRSATVTQTYNDVKLIEPNRADEPAASGARIAGQRGVRTGQQSRAELEFQDKTLTRLGANTIFSFEGGTRSMEMQQGTMLLQVPKNAGGAKIRTAAVTAAITGTTILLEYTPDRVVTEGGKKKKKKGSIKVIVLEGTLKLSLNNGSNQTVTLNAGQMLITDPNTVQLPGAVTVDLARVVETSLLVNNSYWGQAGITGRTGTPDAQGRPARLSMALIDPEVEKQREAIVAGTLLDVNLSNSFYGSDVQTLQLNVVFQLDTRFSVQTESTTPVVPDKFGALPTVQPGNYLVDSTSVFVLDPVVTGPGGTVEGRIYRGEAQDGTPTSYLFGQTASAFDGSVGFNSDAYFQRGGSFPANGVTVFRFTGLNVTGSPTFQTAGGVYTDLALATTGNASVGGSAPFTLNLSPLTSFGLLTQNGSIALAANVTLSATPATLVDLLARGASGSIQSEATITSVASVRMAAESTLAVGGSLSAANALSFVAGGNATVNASLAAPSLDFASQTGTLTLSPGGIATAGLTSLTAAGRTINLTGSFNAGASASTIVFNAGAGGFNAAGFSLSGANRQISVNVTDGGAFSAQNFFGRSLVLTGGGAVNVPGTLDVTTLGASGPLNVGTLNVRDSLSLGSVSAGSIALGGSAANFAASGNVVADALAVPGTLTIGGFLRTAGVLPAAQRIVTAGGNITISGDAGNPAGFPGDHYSSFISTGGDIAVGTSASGLTLYADTIQAAGSVRAGGFISDRIAAGAGGIVSTTSAIQTGSLRTSGEVNAATDLYFNSRGVVAFTLNSASVRIGRDLQLDSIKLLTIATGAATIGGRLTGFVDPGGIGAQVIFGATSLTLSSPSAGPLIDFRGGAAVGAGVGGAGGSLTLNLSGAGGFTLPAGPVVLTGGSGSAAGSTGGAGGQLQLDAAGSVNLFATLDLRGGSGLAANGAGGVVAITAVGDLLAGGSIFTRGEGAAADGSVTLTSSAGSLWLDSTITTGALTLRAGLDLELRAGAAIAGSGPLAIVAGRDFLGLGGTIFSTDYDVTLNIGRDLGIGFFGGRVINVGRNVDALELSIETATIGGQATVGTLRPYQPAGSTNAANVYRLTVGSLGVNDIAFAAAAGSNSARTLQLNTTAGGSLSLGGLVEFRGGSTAAGLTGPGGSFLVNVPGSGTAVPVEFGSNFVFFARGADSTVDGAIAGGAGGTFRLFATGDLAVGGAGNPLIDVRGGDASTLTNGRGGSGGLVELNTTGSLVLSGNIAAGTGVNGPFDAGSIRPLGGLVPPDAVVAGTGGSVTLAAGGDLTVNAGIQVSAPDDLPSASPAPPLQATSLNGGNISLTSAGGSITLGNGADLVAGISDAALALGGVAGRVTLSAPLGNIDLNNGSILNRHGLIEILAPGGTISLGAVDLLAATVNFQGLAIAIGLETPRPQANEVNFVVGSGGLASLSALGDSDLPNGTTITSVGSVTVVNGGIFARFVLATGTNADIRVRDGVVAGNGDISATRDIVATGAAGTGGSLSATGGSIRAGRDIFAPGGVYTGGDPFTITAGRDLTAGSLLGGAITVGRDLHVTDSGTGNFISIDANTLNVPGVFRLTNVSYLSYNNASLGADTAGTPAPFTLNAGSIVTSGFVPSLLFAGAPADSGFVNPGSGGQVNITTAGGLALSATGQFVDLLAHGGDALVGSSSGGDGGHVRIATGGAGFSLGLGSTIRATSALIPDGGPNVLGQGGLVDIRTVGPLTIEGVIVTSQNDDPLAGFSFRTTSASGGSIALRSGLTAGTGIALADGAELRADVLAGQPGGSIALTTAGADIGIGAAGVTATGGTIDLEAPNATITLTGSFLQANRLSVNGASGAPGTLTGYGTILAAYDNAVTLRPGIGAGSTGLTFAGNLTLLGSSRLEFQLGGLTQASQYGFVRVNGVATLGGQFVLAFANGFENSVTNTASFTLLSSSSLLVGAFSNIASGDRYSFAGGSFLITYAGNSVIASDFLPSAGNVAIWDGSGNAWSSGANWSTAPTFPNGNFTAVINGGSVNLDGAYSVNRLNLFGGALGGSGSLDVADVLFRADAGGGNFTGGRITATNGIALESTAGTGPLGAISGNALLVNAGPAGRFFGADGGRGFDGGDNAIFRNAPGATFTVSVDNDFGFSRFGAGSPVFDNQGTFVRSDGSGLFGIYWRFDNSGEVEIESGTLGLGFGGTSSGEWRIDPTARLHLAAGVFNFNGSQVTGGSVLFTGDVLNLTGATTGDATWTFSGGQVGGTGSLTAGSLTFQRDAGQSTDVAAGVLSATGGVGFVAGPDAGALATLSGNALVVSQGAGRFAGVANGDFVAGRDNAVFRNDLGGTFTASVDNAQAFRALSGNPTFDNRGAFVADPGSTGAFGLQWAFLNSGAVQVSSGKLLLAGGGVSTGSFAVASGALLAFTGGTYRLEAGTSFSGGGGVTLTGGTLELGGAIGGSASLLLAGGNLTGPTGSWSLATLIFQRGSAGATTLDSGTLTAANGVVLSAGFGAAPLGTLAGNAVVLNTNNGAFFGAANGDFLVGRDNAIFRNAPGAIFDAQIDHNQGFLNGGGNPVFDNQGTFLRSVATGSFVLDWTFDNRGSVSVESGRLVFNRGGSATAGSTFDTLAGASLAFAGGTYALAGGTTLGGAGTYLLTGGTLDLGGAIAGSPNLLLQGGALTGTGSLTLGSLTFQRGAGAATIVSGTTLTAAGGVFIQSGAAAAAAGEWTGNALVVNAGSGAFSGAAGGEFLLGSGNAIFRNAPGATFVAQADNAQAFRSGGGAPQIQNQGTFDRSGGAGTFGVQWAFANTGTVNAQSGTLAFSGGFQQSGAGAILNLSGGSVSSTSTLDLQGGLLTGFGTLAAALQNNAIIRPALGGAGLAVTGNVTLLSASQLQFQLGGLTQGSQVGFLGVSGSVALGGQLVLSFANGFQNAVTGTDTFTLLTTSVAFSGAFANIASGGRLNTADGFGSFLVTYSGSSLVLSGFQLPAPASAVWDGSTNNWSSGANWSTNPAFPNGNFDATIGAGAVALDGNYSVQAFTLTGGSLAGPNTLTVNGLFTWAGGTLGSGTFVANGGLAINGSALRQLDAAVLNVPAGRSATDSGGHLFLLSNSAVINNAGTWNATGAAGGISFTIGGTNAFNNSGAFVRNGTGDYTFGSVQFNNTGTVDLLTGNLQLNGGGVSTGGSFNLAAGTILRVNTTYTFDAASSVAGAGAVSFTNFSGIAVNGAYNVTGGTSVTGAAVTFNTDAATGTLQLNGTSLALGAGRTLTSSGLFTWQSGTLTGGTLQANGGALFGNAAALALVGATLNVPAGQTLTDSGNHTLTLSGGAILNLAGAFLARNNTGLTNGGGGNQLNVSGTFTRDTGAGTYAVSVPLANTGTVEVQTGTLALNGGGSSSGLFRAGAGAALTFGGSYTANAGTGFTGAGTVTLTGGTLTLGGALSSDVAQFVLALGTLGGPGSLSTTGSFGFGGGVLAAGTTVSAAGVQISGVTGKTLAGTLTNALGASGSDTSTGGSWSFATGGVFNNAGTFDATGATAVAGSGGTINNTGTFNRNGAGTYTVAGAGFVNSGTVNVLGGTLAFNAGYTQTAGTLNLNGGNVSGTTLGFDGGLLTGAGALAADIVNNATLRPALGGTGLAVSGNVSLLGASQLQFQLGGLTQGSQYGFLGVSGSLTLGGQLVLSFVNGFQNSVTVTDTFTLVSTSSLNGAFANIASGARLNTADGFGSFLVNYGGTSVVLSGYQAIVPEALWLGGAGNWSDAMQWSTNPVFPNGNIDARINGGSVRLDSPSFTVRNFTLTGGDLNTAGGRPLSPFAPTGGPPALGVTGLFTWTGGTLLNVGVDALAGTVLNGTGPLLMDGGYLNHSGGTLLDTGAHSWTMANNSVLNLAAPFFARNDAGIASVGMGNQINNQSVFTRDVGTGTYAIAPFFFNDGGSIAANSGTLAFGGGLTNDGALNIATGATVRIGTSFSSNGSVTLGGGTLQLEAANSTVSQIAGTSGTVALGVGSTLSLPGGFNFRGVGGATPTAGGTLLFTGGGLVFGSSTGQIGASAFSGGDASAPGAGGDGGSFTVVSSSTLSLGAGADLNASNGANNTVAFGGRGGSITLRAAGAIALGGNVKVSSTTAGFASANGGTLLVHSDALTGTGIALAAGATLSGGLSATAFAAGGSGGSVTLETTGASTIDLQGTINAPNAAVSISPGGGLTLAAGAINNPGGSLSFNVGGAFSLSGTAIATDSLSVNAASIFLDPTRPFPTLAPASANSFLRATAGNITGGFSSSPSGFISLLAPAGAITLSTGLSTAFTVDARDNIAVTGTLGAFFVTSQTGSISADALSANTVTAQTSVTANTSVTADQVNAASATFHGNVNVRLLNIAGALDLGGASVAPTPNNGTPGAHTFTFGSLTGLPANVTFNGLPGGDPNNTGSGGTLTFNQTGTALLTIGGISVLGADTSATPAGGSNGGSFTVTTPGAFTLTGTISAYSGLIPAAGPAFFGAGGRVSVTSGGTLTIGQPIYASLAQAPGAPHVQSAVGGQISLTSSATSGTGLQISSDLAAPLSNAAFLAGGAGGSITLRAAGGAGIAFAPVTLDAQNGTIDIGYTTGSGPVSFANVGLARLGAHLINLAGFSLVWNNVQLGATGAAVFDIGNGGISGNAFLGNSAGGSFTVTSLGPIALTAGLAVTSPLSASSIAVTTLSAPSVATTVGDLAASGTLLVDTVNVAGVFSLNSGVNVLAPYSAPNAQGTPAAVTFSAGQYNAPSLQFNLNGLVGGNPNFAGNGGTLDLRSTTAGLPMFVANIIHNLNASGAPTSATPAGGSNGGNLRLESAGDLTIGGPVIATTGVIPTAGPDVFGTGGTVQVFAAGTISLSGFNPGILVSSAEAPGANHAASLNGGIISLQSLLTTGRAIDALNLVAPLSNAALLAGGTPSLVTLTTPGGDIYLRGADVTNGTLSLSIGGPSGTAFLPDPGAIRAGNFNITAGALNVSTIFSPTVTGTATWSIGAGGITANVLGLNGGGLLNITSVGGLTATGGVSANSLDVVGATSAINIGGDLTLTGNLLRNSSADITANSITLLGANALLSSQGNVSTLSGNGLRLPGATSSVAIAGAALGGAISAGSVSIGGNASISTGFLVPYGIEANSISVGGIVNSLNAVFFGPRDFVAGTPAPFTFSLLGFATQGSIIMPEVRANGQDTIVTGGEAGNGGSLTLTVTGTGGLTIGGSTPDLLAVTARGGDLPDAPTSGGNGGQIVLTSAGPVRLASGGLVSATTGLLSYAAPDAFGAGGSIIINAPAFQSDGTVVASADEGVSSFYRSSLTGGSIAINASAASGTSIDLSAGSSLIADRNLGAGGAGGSITLTSNGSDIRVDIGGQISVSGGSLTIQTYRPGNAVAGSLGFFGSGFRFVNAASAITLRANGIVYGGDTNLLPAGVALNIAVGSGGLNSAASFYTDGTAPFALTATGDVDVSGNLGVQTFGSTSTITLGLGNLSVSTQLRADTITSAGGTISGRMVDARTINGFVVEATEGSLKVDALTATLASVSNGAFSYQTAGVAHVWNVGDLRGVGALADLDFRGLDGASSLPDGLRGEALTLTLGGSLVVDDPMASLGVSSISFDGGNAATSAGQAGDGGTFTASVNGDFIVAAGRTVSATSGQIQPGGPNTSGRGGTVDVSATGNIEVAGTIQVSSDEPSTPPRRRSNQGGNIRLTSSRGGSSPQTSIKIESTAQLNALLNAAATGPGGRVTIVATGTNARVQMNGRARADRGTVEIRSNGAGGSVTTSASTDVRGDIVKIGALGNNGVLTIGGGTFSADTTLQLYATGSNGQVQFTGNTTLQGSSLKYIAGQTVTVNNSVQVNIQGTTPVQIFTNVPNYSGSGGNGSTTGTFTGQGAVTNPLGGQPGF